MMAPIDLAVRGERRGQRVGQAVDARASARRSGRRPVCRSPAIRSGAWHGVAVGRVVGSPSGATAPMREPRSSSRPRRPPPRPARRRSATTGMATGIAFRPIRLGDDRILEVGDRQPGRRVGHAGPGADQRRLEDPCVGAAAGDDDVVGAGRLGQLARRSRRGSRRARSSATGSTGSARTTRPPRGDRPRGPRRPGGGGSRRTRRRAARPTTAQSIGRACLGGEPKDGDQAEDEERAGEDPPGASSCDVQVSRRGGQAGWRDHSRREQRMAVRARPVHPRPLVPMAIADQYFRTGRSVRLPGSPARAAS